MKYKKLVDLIKYKREIISSIDSPYDSDRNPIKESVDCSICHLISFYVMDIMESCKTEIQLDNTKNWALNITKNGTPFLNNNSEYSKNWWIDFINTQYEKNKERIKYEKI